jgi:hypothetical protein
VHGRLRQPEIIGNVGDPEIGAVGVREVKQDVGRALDGSYRLAAVDISQIELGPTTPFLFASAGR